MQHVQLERLLSEMTMDEKIGQLLQISGDFYSTTAQERTGPMSQLGLTEREITNAGSVLGVGGAAECRRIQTEYMARHRLHIPTLFMGDVIHGYRTIFPIPLGLASSWDVDAAAQMARISARESAVSGLFLTFSPMVDLVRDPRWGRVMESTGEDPRLNAEFARAMVRGYQGGDLRNDVQRVAACVKHFAAYGAPVGGRDYNTVDMSERELRDMYLPGYRAAIEAGAKTVMTSFNTVNGMPASGNKHLLRDILRKEWGFDGALISDYEAVRELVTNGVAQDDEQAAKLAIEAGVDIEMMSVCYLRHLRDLVESGRVDCAIVDEAVMRVLELKNDLGLFENPLRGADEGRERSVVLSDEHRAAARDIAGECVVLLKNDAGILPLHADVPASIALAGPCATSHDLLGAWSWQGRQKETVSLAEGLLARHPHAVTVARESCDYDDPSPAAIAEAVDMARSASVVVLALGETSDMSGEAASRSDIRLPHGQIDMLRAVRAVNPNVVVVLFNGRPLDLTEVDREARAIVEAWFPGTEAGRAVADVLVGATNPSGKLTMSFPRTVGQVPVYYNSCSTGRPYEAKPREKYVSKYLDVANDPLYPFGFGLSYSTFSYGPVTVSGAEFDDRHPLRVDVSIANTSDVDGVEIAQLYVRDLVGDAVRPVKELKGFSRVRIAAGSSVTVTFSLISDDVRYVHPDLAFTSDPGEFDIMVGPDSRHLSSPIRVVLKS